MKQIFFIYRDSVVTELTKSILDSHGVSTYALNDITEDFSYIVNDLEPELVLIDEALYEGNEELIMASLKNCTVAQSKWVFLSEDMQKAHPFHLSFQLPLKAKSIFEDLKELVDSELVQN